MSTNLDPRVIRTRKLLQDALLKLIHDKGYHNITVQDITAAATLNRSTFYKHYRDKDDLLQSVIQSVLDELSTIHPKPNAEGDLMDIRNLYVWIFEHVQQHRDFYHLMLENQTVAPFTQQMQQSLQQLVSRLVIRYRTPRMTMPPNLYASFVSASFLGIVKWWIIEAQDVPTEQIALRFMQLTLGGMIHEFMLDAEALLGQN